MLGQILFIKVGKIFLFYLDFYCKIIVALSIILVAFYIMLILRHHIYTFFISLLENIIYNFVFKATGQQTTFYRSPSYMKPQKCVHVFPPWYLIPDTLMLGCEI